MKKCLLWGTGYCFREYVNLVKYHEMRGEFVVVGVTSNFSIFDNYAGYRYICKEKLLKEIDFDFVIVMAEGNAFKEIYAEALAIGVGDENILGYSLLKRQWFDLEKYMRVKRDVPTIFSCDCWGGLTYHNLGLEFKSPLINMFEIQTDFMKLLRKPQYYMEQKIEFLEYCTNRTSKKTYPVCRCEDILLHFYHYDTFENAVVDWERRKQRIKWDNLFVMMHTENQDLAYEFATLPYKKKICFVPFQTDAESLVYIDFRDIMRNIRFSDIAIMMAKGEIEYYNVLDLLERGKFVKMNL